MYQNLVRSYDPNAPESVHHCPYPQFDESLYTEGLAEEMDLVADVVSRVLSLRENKQIRVRQPLSRLIVDSQNDKSSHVLKRYEDHIKDELNIKEIQIDLVEKYEKYDIKPNHKSLGPKFGKDVKKIIALLAEKSPAEVAAAVRKNENITLQKDDQTWQLQPEDVIIARQKDQNLEFSVEAGPALILDVQITDELRQEGWARDFVRHVQQLRKEKGFEIQNRIVTKYFCPDNDKLSALNNYQDYICNETLSNSINLVESSEVTRGKEIKIGGSLFHLDLVRAEKSKIDAKG